ncbi:MAG: homoserine dehydrogenase [Actinomycetota bacterium]|jgi:homoserine dehydrogenase|nr:homoserine dehydrogenase [Actinomycetota bacterium]
MTDNPVRVGILGCGNVGAELVKLLTRDADLIDSQTGERFEIASVAVRSLDRERPAWVDRSLLTADPFEVVSDPDVDIVVEVMGGISPTRELIEKALANGKSVVTANKALLAVAGAELTQLARSVGRDIFFEAAVAGGIPLIRSLRVSLAGERVRSVAGIVNGTTNFILSSMTENGSSYEEALALATELGYAEADPSADVEGEDARAKAAILATVAFGRMVRSQDVYREGITGISAEDIDFAKRHGFVIKLLALCESGQDASGRDRIAVRVHPALVAEDHPLALVRDSFNAIFVTGEAVGELMFYGRGAGGLPTASAVLGDVIDAAHNLRYGVTERQLEREVASIVPVEEMENRFYIAIDVNDKPGVLASVAQVFGSNMVSIRSMEQTGIDDQARLVFITHPAPESSVTKTLEGLRSLPAVRRVAGFIRVFDPS